MVFRVSRKDARAFYQGEHQIRHLRQHVKHAVARPALRPGGPMSIQLKHRFHFAEKVGMGKHYALGIGGARSVEQRGEDRPKRAGNFLAQIKNRRGKFAIQRSEGQCPPCGPGSSQHEPDVEVRPVILRAACVCCVAE